jgi:hypothetical protein
MRRRIIAGDVEYAQVLLRVGTAAGKIVQALVYRGLRRDLAERLVEDLKSGKQVEVQEPEPASAAPREGLQREIPVPQGIAPNKHPSIAVRGVRLLVILPPLLALALAMSAAWWWKAVPEDLREYLKQGFPRCPGGGVYTVNSLSQEPTCSLAGHGEYVQIPAPKLLQRRQRP